MKSLILEATRAIYSETSEFEDVLERLESKGDKLSALTAIHAAALTDAEIDGEFVKLCIENVKQAKIDFPTKREMDNYLRLLSDETKIEWLTRVEKILKGKLAHKIDKNSIEGIIYRMEFQKKGPLSQKEFEGARYHAASNVINKMSEEAKEKRKNMTEEEKLEDSKKAKLDLAKSQRQLDNILKNKRNK